jgi:hypothetical protein
MKLITIRTFDNAVEANIVKGKLLDSEIMCFLKDENMVGLDPIYSNAMGGIKLQVDEKDADLALELLNLSNNSYKEELSCPICKSNNVHFVSSRKSTGNIFAFILSLVLFYTPIYVKKVYCCYNCKSEFDVLDE